MADPFAGYDSWLVRPDQERLAQQDAFLHWCEGEELDPDDEESWDRWEQHIVEAP